MAALNIPLRMPRRAALLTPRCDNAARGLVKNVPVPVWVLGLFQVTTEDGDDAYFICEQVDGHCLYASPCEIQFAEDPR